MPNCFSFKVKKYTDFNKKKKTKGSHEEFTSFQTAVVTTTIKGETPLKSPVNMVAL